VITVEIGSRRALRLHGIFRNRPHSLSGLTCLMPSAGVRGANLFGYFVT
jgi:hypothetical protein